MQLTSTPVPAITDYRSCLQFYRDVLGFAVVKGNEQSSSSELRRGNMNVTFIQAGLPGRNRTVMVGSIIRKKR